MWSLCFHALVGYLHILHICTFNSRLIYLFSLFHHQSICSPIFLARIRRFFLHYFLMHLVVKNFARALKALFSYCCFMSIFLFLLHFIFEFLLCFRLRIIQNRGLVVVVTLQIVALEVQTTMLDVGA